MPFPSVGCCGRYAIVLLDPGCMCWPEPAIPAPESVAPIPSWRRAAVRNFACGVSVRRCSISPRWLCGQIYRNPMQFQARLPSFSARHGKFTSVIRSQDRSKLSGSRARRECVYIRDFPDDHNRQAKISRNWLASRSQYAADLKPAAENWRAARIRSAPTDRKPYSRTQTLRVALLPLWRKFLAKCVRRQGSDRVAPTRF